MNLCWLFRCERRPPTEEEMKSLKDQVKEKKDDKAKKKILKKEDQILKKEDEILAQRRSPSTPQEETDEEIP